MRRNKSWRKRSRRRWMSGKRRRSQRGGTGGDGDVVEGENAE